MDFPEHALRLLPEPSRAKLEALMIERQAARAAYFDASDTEQQLRRDAALVEAEARQRLDAWPGVSQHPAAAVAEAQKRATEAGRAEREAHEARILAPADAARLIDRPALAGRPRSKGW